VFCWLFWLAVAAATVLVAGPQPSPHEQPSAPDRLSA
jgi:hypothetical protein